MIKKSIVSAAVATAVFALSAPASATLTNWYIDTDGAGGNAAVMVKDYLDLVGAAYVKNTFTSGTGFTFQEAGRFTTNTADGGTLIGGSNLNPGLSSYFIATGSGTTGGALTFNAGGTLDVFSGLNNIADFSLLEGSANLLANSTLPNGTVSLIFKATSMMTGYFFDSAMNDLATAANSIDGIVLGFGTTNAISLAGQTVSSALITDFNAAFNPDVPFTTVGNNTTDLYISNNGQFRLDVPEPSMLSLLGLALVGVGFSTRRKSKV